MGKTISTLLKNSNFAPKWLRDLLRPFAEAVRELEGDNYSTLSKVVPAVIDSIEHSPDNGSGIVGITKTEINHEMERRFTRIYDTSNSDFAPVHLVATFFDPEYVIGLTKRQKSSCIDIITQRAIQ